MAPKGESCYFPPLDRCLNGKHQLFSWKTVFVGLSQLGDTPNNGPLKKHLTDHQTIDILARPFSPYSTPTPQTKLSFETKTSAINIPPSGHGQYDIRQIQEDTLWLSKKTNISELEALRIAVLEWQTWPAQRLLQGSPYDEVFNLRSTVGVDGLAASLQGSVQSRLVAQEQDESSNFDSSQARRLRILKTYLSERRYIIKTSEYVVFGAIFEASLHLESSFKSSLRGKLPKRTGWVEEIGNSILTTWNLNGVVQDSGKNFSVAAVDALDARVDNLINGSGWLQEDDFPEAIEAAWGENQIVEMIHIMQTILALLSAPIKLTRIDVLLAWFRFASKYGFFETFEISYDGLRGAYDLPLQSLIALVSLALLNIPMALEMIMQISTAPPAAATLRDEAPYLLNLSGIVEINDILISAAVNGSTNASPAVLAWGIILQTIREYALVSRESREIKQSVRATEKYGTPDALDPDGMERPSLRSGLSRQRRSSTSSETSQQSSFLEDVLDRVLDTALDEDPIAYLAKSAVDGSSVFNVIAALAVDYCGIFGSDHDGKSGFKIRRVLLGLIRAVLEWVEYQPMLILALLAILTGNECYWDMLNRPQGLKDAEPASSFLTDDLFMQRIFQTALTRFPYETLPFLKFCRALAVTNEEGEKGLPAIWCLIQNLDSLTCALPVEFTAYQIIREDEEANYVQLTGNLSFNEHVSGVPSKNPSTYNKPPRVLMESSSGLGFQQLPVGTMGRVLSESKPLVVMWRYDYSPIAYVGKLLSMFSVEGDASTPASTSREVIAEIIDLLTIMISVSVQRTSDVEASTAQETAQIILETASDGLERNQDVVSTIFQIIENELHRCHNVSDEPGSLDILVRCIQFSHALLPVMPDRVWPFLGRSSLLGKDGMGSQLNTIVTSFEMASGRYDFLMGCVRLFDALLDDSIAHAVSHRIPTTTIKRFADTERLGTGISQIAMEKVISSLQRTMVDVFESALSWKFAIQEERAEMNTMICTIFQKLLSYCYDIDEQTESSHKLARPLTPAAEYLITAFLSPLRNNITVNPLLRILLGGVATPTSSLSVRGLQQKIIEVRAALLLSTSLLRVNSLLERPQSHLQRELFRATPALAKVYASHESYKLPTVQLFDALICSIDPADPEPPSLLGHLGQDTASRFLELLSIFDQPFSDDALSIEIWRLLSGVISRRQQWFAIFVLTGSTPRDSFKNSKTADHLASHRADPMLTIAMDGLTHIDRVDPMVAIAMLEFIALAADYWPWVLTKIEEHPNFLSSMTEFVIDLEPPPDVRSIQASTYHVKLQMVSFVLEILSMYINFTQQSGNLILAKKLLPSLTFYTWYAAAVSGYNASLHGNLRRNFESKFVGCTLTKFKRSRVKRPFLGESFYYDLEMADKMLAFDPAWIGNRGQGFAGEISRANLNLSLVEAQANLLHGWKFFIIEISKALGTDAKVQSLMALTIMSCLRANTQSSGPEVIFERLMLSRAELAFTLLQRLIELKSRDKELQKILPTIWDTIRNYETDIGLALVGKNAEYYRTLLKILCLALQACTSVPPSDRSESSRSEPKEEDRQLSLAVPSSVIPIIIEVLGVVVARGFRSLITVLHDDPTRVLPTDFALIIALLRTGLQLPGIERHTTQILSHFTDHQTARYASALLSWADQIVTDHDPVYGELSIAFLLELSSIPVLAESLAVEGILTQISSTNLITYLRQGKGTGPFENPPRLYSIWSRGILPLLLNLLYAIGAPMASEIAAALNSFPDQIAHASSAFLGKSISSADPTAGFITLSMVSEAQTLAVITAVLDTFREAGPSVGVSAKQIAEPAWDRIQVKDQIDTLLQRRTALRNRIFPSNEKEEAWLRQPPVSATSGAESLLEEKMVGELRMVLRILDYVGQ